MSHDIPARQGGPDRRAAVALPDTAIRRMIRHPGRRVASVPRPSTTTNCLLLSPATVPRRAGRRRHATGVRRRRGSGGPAPQRVQERLPAARPGSQRCGGGCAAGGRTAQRTVCGCRAGDPISVWAVVLSLTSCPGQHPLLMIASWLRPRRATRHPPTCPTVGQSEGNNTSGRSATACCWLFPSCSPSLQIPQVRRSDSESVNRRPCRIGAGGRGAAVEMLSCSRDTVQSDLEAAKDRPTGSFRDSCHSRVDDLVALAAIQKLIVATATVPAAASVSTSGGHAVALLFVNQSITVGDETPIITNSYARDRERSSRPLARFRI